MSRGAAARWLAALLAAAGAGGLAGCGSGGAGSTQPTTATLSVSVSSAAADPTTDTPSITATTTTPPADTASDLPGAGRPAILLGDMNTPEQFIIGDLYADALGAEGYTVDLNRNIGPTPVSQAAMSQGSLDVLPEYLNVYDAQVAGVTQQFGTLAEALAAGQSYANAHGQTLLTPTPFSDTSGVVVLTSFARAHHLRTMADLQRVQAQLTFGSPLEFSTEPDGLATLEQAYGFTPAVTTVVTIGDQYDALVSHEVQAAYDQTTDWQLTEPIYTDLPDSDHVLGWGNLVPVVSTSVIAAEGPEFVHTLDAVDALLTTRAIRGLTSEMEDATEPAVAAAEVAKEFLQGYGILPPPAWSTVPTPAPPVPALTTTSVETSTTPLTSPAAEPGLPGN